MHTKVPFVSIYIREENSVWMGGGSTDGSVVSGDLAPSAAVALSPLAIIIVMYYKQERICHSLQAV